MITLTSIVPGTEGEGVECLLNIRLITLEPTFGAVCLDVISPNALVPVDRVAWDTQDSSCREELIKDSEASFRNNSGKPQCGRRMESQSFVDTSVEVGKAFALLPGCD